MEKGSLFNAVSAIASAVSVALAVIAIVAANDISSTEEQRNAPQLEATVAGWYQVAGTLNDAPAPGVPVLVTLVTNAGRNPLVLAGAVQQASNGVSSPIDLAYTVPGLDPIRAPGVTVNPGEMKTILWTFQSDSVWGTDATSLELTDVTTGKELEVLDVPEPSGGEKSHGARCEISLRVACEHALVLASRELKTPDLQELMCVPQARSFGSLGPLHQEFCAQWLDSQGWSAINPDIQKYLE